MGGRTHRVFAETMEVCKNQMVSAFPQRKFLRNPWRAQNMSVEASYILDIEEIICIAKICC